MEPLDDRPVATPALLRQVIERSPFTRSLGTRLITCGRGRAELEVPITSDLTQHHGFVHGAVIGCVADNACAWAAASVAGDVVTLEYKLSLLSPAVGQKLVGRGRVVKASRRVVTATADVLVPTNAGEKLVATMLATILPRLQS